MRAASTPMPGGEGAPAALSALRRYRVTDALSGEEIDLPAAGLEAALGIEIGYIDWCLACEGAFDDGRWRVAVAPRGRGIPAWSHCARMAMQQGGIGGGRTDRGGLHPHSPTAHRSVLSQEDISSREQRDLGK